MNNDGSVKNRPPRRETVAQYGQTCVSAHNKGAHTGAPLRILYGRYDIRFSTHSTNKIDLTNQKHFYRS